MTIPKHLEKWPRSYSNFDLEHPGEEAENAVRAGTHFIEHTAWDHHGIIWFEGGRFVEQVKVHRSKQEPLYGSTLGEVFEAVNEQHGWE